MYEVVFYTLLSVLIVSLVSLVGVITLFFKEQKLDRMLMFLVSLSAGSLLGSAFFHLLPEKMKEQGGELGINISLAVLGGFLLFFALEKFVHWRHCHVLPHKAHPHHLAV
ncbi:MAG: ZIP family metal transporter, partial [Nanoarchaeota archaeon]